VANSGVTPFTSGIRGSSPTGIGNTVTIIDVATLQEEPNKITVGMFPEDIAFAHDGLQALVTNSSDNTVSVIDTVTRAVTQTISVAPLGLAFPFGITVSKNGTEAFMSTDGQTTLNSIGVFDIRDADNVKLDGAIAATLFNARMAIRPRSDELLVPSSTSPVGPPILLVIDPGSRKIKSQVMVPNNTGLPEDIAVTPDGRFAYVTLFDFAGGSGGVWVVDLDKMETVTIINTGDPNTSGAGMTHDGRFVFATNFGVGSVSVIDTRSNQVVATVPVGNMPNKVAVTLDDRLAFVTNEGDTTVSVFRIDED